MLRDKRQAKMSFLLAIKFFLAFMLLFCLTLFAFFILDKLSIKLRSEGISVIMMFVLCLFCEALGILSANFVTLRVMKPINKISEASKKIAKGDYNVELEYAGEMEEIAIMIENFNKMAKELNSIEMIRNDFIANVSHEFKTPLTSLSGYLTLLQNPELTEEEKKEYIDKAFFSIEKLNTLTTNILSISKIENSAVLDEPKEYRLDEQIREAIVLLEPKWYDRQIDFNIDMPEIVYKGQKELLFQVWMNIISNAIKFSADNSEIMIRIEQTAHHVKVYISDNGIGMDEETLKHIFDKFYQADSSRQTQGNGLGLALCKEIVTRCNGKIYVTSTLGKGSVFVVSLKTVN